jgi:hypothetical protein
VESGSLSSSQPQDFRSLVLGEEQVLHLTISDASSATANSAMEAALYDSNGRFLYDVIIPAGGSASVELFLAAGTYTLRFSGGTQDGSPLALSYRVSGASLGYPIGPPLLNPDQPPALPQVDPTWLNTGLLQILALLDPYGKPFGTSGSFGTGAS